MITIVTALLITLIGLGVIATIATIGKERKPLTPGIAIATLVISVLQIAGILYLAAH